MLAVQFFDDGLLVRADVISRDGFQVSGHAKVFALQAYIDATEQAFQKEGVNVHISIPS